MRDRRGIPAGILSGRNKKYPQVYNLYRALMAQEFMRILNKSFWSRARTGHDKDGNAWQPLKPTTIRKKRDMYDPLLNNGIAMNWYELVMDHPFNTSDRNSNPSKLNVKLNPASLSKEDRDLYYSIVKRLVSEDRSSNPHKVAKAKRDAWKEMSGREPFAKLINIRTGRLVAATAPGTVVNNRYYPATEDQKVRITWNYTHISLNSVPYARAVDNQREIIPSGSLQVWLDEAHEAVIDEVAALYRELNPEAYDENGNPTNAQTNKRKRKSRKIDPTDIYSDDVPF